MSLLRWGGIASFVLYGAVAALMIDMPGVDVSADAQHAFVREHRTAMLIGTYLWGLCTCATFAFLTGLWSVLKKKHEGHATLGLGAGFAIFTLALAGFGLSLGSAYGVEHHPAATTKLLNDLNFLFVCLTGFPTAASMIASAAVKDGMPGWLKWSAVGIALVHLVSGGSFAMSGILSPSGLGIYVAPVLYYVWILAAALTAKRWA